MSKAAVEGGPDTDKPLAPPAAGVMATACRDAPPCTPAPHRSLRTPRCHRQPLCPLLSPQARGGWWWWLGVTGGRETLRVHLRRVCPERDCLFFKRVLCDRHGPASKGRSKLGSPGAGRNLPVDFPGMSVSSWEGWRPGS